MIIAISKSNINVRLKKIQIPQPQSHHRETVALAQLMLVGQNHYRYQMASEHSQEVQHSENVIHDPPTSREESIQWETKMNQSKNSLVHKEQSITDNRQVKDMKEK